MTPTSISGLKQSPPWGLFSVPLPLGAGLANLLAELAGRRVNLTYFTCAGSPQGRERVILAVPGAQAPLASQVLEASGMAGCQAQAPVAGLTLYPKGEGIRLPVLALAALLEQGIRPLSLATSLSALTVVMDTKLCPAARQSLARRLGLAQGASPHDQAVPVVQAEADTDQKFDPDTVAVYAEDPVATYGLAVRKGQALLAASCPESSLARSLHDTGMEACILKAAWCALREVGDAWRLEACLPFEAANHIAGKLHQKGFACERAPDLACLVHLQGPHFGDRHGILAAALGTLEEAHLTPLAVSAVLHSIYLTFRPGQGDAALVALGLRFRGPS